MRSWAFRFWVLSRTVRRETEERERDAGHEHGVQNHFVVSDWNNRISSIHSTHHIVIIRISVFHWKHDVSWRSVGGRIGTRRRFSISRFFFQISLSI